ncbi:unnamed protein product [Microthlaspi erraticum]|uniref:Uncharacterized protein n=1 Tax=Microthlaspi erraticum TaxID=1685480 RepID=A0A6D2HJV0_9BRAS|nr:unnamed protein product [Microthlaspi erraticum]
MLLRKPRSEMLIFTFFLLFSFRIKTRFCIQVRNVGLGANCYNIIFIKQLAPSPTFKDLNAEPCLIRPTFPDLNAEPCFDSEREETEETEDKHFTPRLSKEHQLEIFLRASYFEYSKLQFYNKQLSHFFENREIFRVWQERGHVHLGGGSHWTIVYTKFRNF